MQLEFDFIAEMEKAERQNAISNIIPKLLHFEEPKNDNEWLLNYQYDFYNGDMSAWHKLWTLSYTVVHRMFTTQIRKNRLHYSFDERYDRELYAVEYVLRRFKKAKPYFIRYDFLKQLKGGVLHAIYYQTKADKLVDFMSDEQLYTMRGEEQIAENDEHQND